MDEQNCYKPLDSIYTPSTTQEIDVPNIDEIGENAGIDPREFEKHEPKTTPNK